MKKNSKEKLTILDVVNNIINSDLPLSTRNEITRHYMLPKLGYTKAIAEERRFSVGTVERPGIEEIETENNPKLKESDKEFERLAGVEDEEEDE